MATSTIKNGKLTFKSRTFTFGPASGTYDEREIDISEPGYTPLTIEWNATQIGTIVYDCRILSGPKLRIGRSMNNGGSLSSNTLYVKVTYIKDVWGGST